jgi:hypothetical protein
MVERVSRDDAKPDPGDSDGPSVAGNDPADVPEAQPAMKRGKAETGPITFEQIRERAYELWERNHRPEGFEIQFWLLAERELRTERERRRPGDGAGPPEDDV